MFVNVKSNFLVPAFFHGAFLRMYLLLISATGRSPNTKRLNLEAVGVELDQAGAVKVVTNSRLCYP